MRTTLKTLEWERFLKLAQGEARSEPGQAVLFRLEDPVNWAQDLNSARRIQQETQEAYSLLERDALWGALNGLLDPTTILERLGRGASLDVPDLALLRKWLFAVDAWAQLPREEIHAEQLRKALAKLMDPYEPLRILDRILTPEGELSEQASPKLSSLYAEVSSLKKEIARIMDDLLKRYEHDGILQENYTDFRDGRYVLPIKISAQSGFNGTIYDASSSGQTVFAEPNEVAPLGNRLKQAQNSIFLEIRRILEEVAPKIRPFGPEIYQSVEVLAYWDSVQARTRLGRHYGGRPISVVEERTFALAQSAHPLLWWALPPEKIVRNDVDFGEPSQALLITGPNTGGKTVLLKALGIAAACARTGFPFPGTAVVPFFSDIFADLGDSQSIEQHLSSFSGHVLSLKSIFEKASATSLVLIDELNTATDPEEGGALSRAFLESIAERGSLIVSTTHDPHLKLLSTQDPRILNASMEFDESQHIPTYRLVIGVPGRSRALDTAQRLGVPNEIIERAKKYLSAGHLSLESLLKRLESDALETACAKKEALQLREEAEKLQMTWRERTETSISDVLDRIRQRLRNILEHAQDEVRASVRRLEDARTHKDVDRVRAELNKDFSAHAAELDKVLQDEAPDIAKGLAEKQESRHEAVPTIEIGAMVRIPKFKTTGLVTELAAGRVKVAMGKLQMSLLSSDVQFLESPKKQAAKIGGVSNLNDAARELDLRGMRLDDAMTALEHYLDQAFRSSVLSEVIVIHGLGTGALREGARKMLSKLPYIKNFRDAGPGQGGTGATVIEFDR